LTDIIIHYNRDEGVCFAIQKGLVASRSAIRWFKHFTSKNIQICFRKSWL